MNELVTREELLNNTVTADHRGQRPPGSQGIPHRKHLIRSICLSSTPFGQMFFLLLFQRDQQRILKNRKQGRSHGSLYPIIAFHSKTSGKTGDYDIKEIWQNRRSAPDLFNIPKYPHVVCFAEVLPRLMQGVYTNTVSQGCRMCHYCITAVQDADRKRYRCVAEIKVKADPGALSAHVIL